MGAAVAYDPECVDFGVALRAVHQLYRNGKWACLAELGIARSALYTGAIEHEGVAIPVTDTVEHLFEMAVDSVDSVRTVRGLRQFMKLCPFALEAAAQMLHRYLVVTKDSRRVYYFSEKRKGETA